MSDDQAIQTESDGQSKRTWRKNRPEMREAREVVVPSRFLVRKVRDDEDALDFHVTTEVAYKGCAYYEYAPTEDEIEELSEALSERKQETLQRELLLVQELFEVTGVQAVELSRYCVRVYKGEAFEWPEILLPIARAIYSTAYRPLSEKALEKIIKKIQPVEAKEPTGTLSRG